MKPLLRADKLLGGIPLLLLLVELLLLLLVELLLLRVMIKQTPTIILPK
tara:strand:- start:565 stop:711 length:147 start_codon:yes stop_codon:yes gene_type:complete